MKYFRKGIHYMRYILKKWNQKGRKGTWRRTCEFGKLANGDVSHPTSRNSSVVLRLENLNVDILDTSFCLIVCSIHFLLRLLSMLAPYDSKEEGVEKDCLLPKRD